VRGEPDEQLDDEEGDDEGEGDLQSASVARAGSGGRVCVVAVLVARAVIVHSKSVPPVQGYGAPMAALTEHEMNELADRLLAAIGAADEAALREVYSPDAGIWHNFDQKDQTVDENLLTLHDLHRRLDGLAYTEIRRFLAPGGFVQQHVLTGRAKAGPVCIPAMIRFTVEDGRITRLEEYLDTRQALVMYAKP
jgi:ketosteroid isomerase-like protein